jgi:FixJ family two-component response regulator
MSASTSIHVAVVDDDESVCRSLGHLLNASDIDPTAYLSAEAFLADPKHLEFDCLVLDIQFQGMSGIELQKHLAAEKSRTPIIFITAHEDPEVRGQAIEAGCAAFFQKNEAGSSVISAIRRAVAIPSARATRTQQRN